MREGGALRVEVGDPDQLRRYVFPRPPDGVAAVGAAVDMPAVLLKVPAPEPVVRALLLPHWRVERTGTVMTRGELPSRPADLPDGYLTERLEQDGVILMRITTVSGEGAAQGRLVIVDRLAIHDRIRTEPAHGRRGLGRAVMTILGTLARERGVNGGALVATAAGVPLYRSLGWAERAPYVTAEVRR